MAAGKCPATAKEEDVNNTQCGLAATFAVISGFFSAYHFQGVLRHPAAAVARSLRSRTAEERDVALGLPKHNTTLIPGLNVTLSTLDSHKDASGSTWYQYSYQGHDLETDHMHQATLRLHPDGRSQIFAPVDSSAHEKRAETAVNAYYSWVSIIDIESSFGQR